METVITAAIAGLICAIINGVLNAWTWYFTEPGTHDSSTTYATAAYWIVSSIRDPGTRARTAGLMAAMPGGIGGGLTAWTWLSTPSAHTGIIAGVVAGALILGIRLRSIYGVITGALLGGVAVSLLLITGIVIVK